MIASIAVSNAASIIGSALLTYVYCINKMVLEQDEEASNKSVDSVDFQYQITNKKLPSQHSQSEPENVTGKKEKTVQHDVLFFPYKINDDQAFRI